MAACPSCSTETLPGAKFCMNCGTKLIVACVVCGEQLPDGARFCPSCGAPAGGSPNTAAPVAAPSVEPAPLGAGEERRIITALFADLAGFTSHTESADPEDVRERLTTYHRHVREEVERYDGRIEKLLGDGVFAVFGVPTAHEDDPERAVRTALRIQETVERLNEENPGLALSVRIAVTTGEAIVQMDRTDQDREGIVGDVVNTASRLENVAPTGGVIVDERTYLASSSMIDYHPLAPVELKGKADATPIWKAEGAKGRYGIAVEEQSDTPFVGREAELNLLVDTFERVLREESTQLVTVIGEPGVGKSRLMNEFRRVVDGRPEFVWWRQGRCLPLGEGITFWAVGEIVKAQAGLYDSDPPWQAQQKLRDAVHSLIDDRTQADWVLSRLMPLTGLAESESTIERTELFNAWSRFFEALAARRPLLMVIEDLHWADDALVEFLDHLIEWATSSPIMLIATARPELLQKRPTWGAGKLNAASIGLRPLSEEATKQLLAGLLPGRLMSADVQQRLLERCGGNPLYATEFVRLLVEQGSRVEDLSLPDSVQAITATRLDLLSSQDRLVLQVAAVAGKVFWSGAVAFVLPLSRDEIRGSLKRLASKDLIRSIKKSSIEGEDEWIFGHALIRDVAYGQIARSDRATRHEQIGRWIETTSKDRVTDISEVLAYHFGEAMRLQSNPDDELASRAYGALMAAATRTRALDVPRAVAFYAEAAEIATSERDKGLALLAATKDSPDLEEYRAFAERAIEVFEKLDDPENLARALGQRAAYLWWTGDTAGAKAQHDASFALIEDQLESAVGAEVLTSLASYYWRTGKPLEAEATIERARPIVERYGDFQTRERHLSVTAGNRLQMGDVSGLELTEQVLRMSLDRGESARAASSYNNLATHLLFFEPAERVLAKIDEGIEFTQARGLVAAESWSRMTRLESLFPLGRLDEALTQVKALLEDREGAGAWESGSQVWMGLRSWELYLNHLLGLPQQDITPVLTAVRANDDPQIRGPSLTWCMMAAWDRGEHDLAQTIADELSAAYEGDPQVQALVFPTAGDVLIEMGRTDLLEEMNITLGSVWRYQEANHRRTKGVLAEADGDLDTAVEALRASMAIFDLLGHKFGPVWAGIPLARVLLAQGKDAEANALLDMIEPQAVEMNAGLFLDQIASIRGTSATPSATSEAG